DRSLGRPLAADHGSKLVERSTKRNDPHDRYERGEQRRVRDMAKAQREARAKPLQWQQEGATRDRHPEHADRDEPRLALRDQPAERAEPTRAEYRSREQVLGDPIPE